MNVAEPGQPPVAEPGQPSVSESGQRSVSEPGQPSVSESDWSDWRLRIFGDPYLVWHDGADFDQLLGAARTEPETVARMLVAGIRSGDALAPQAVRALAEATGAASVPAEVVDVLRAALPAARGTMLVRAAEALYALTGDEAWAERVTSVLASRTHWSDRIDAAMSLAGFPPTPALIGALARAVRSPTYLVRYHAANTLLRYAGRAELSEQPDLFELVKSDAADGKPREQRAAAARQLAAAAMSRLDRAD